MSIQDLTLAPPDLYHLGEVKRLRGDAAAALELERTALAMSQKKYGENTRYTAMTHHMLALALRDQGDSPGPARSASCARRSPPTPDTFHRLNIRSPQPVDMSWDYC